MAVSSPNPTGAAARQCAALVAAAPSHVAGQGRRQLSGGGTAYVAAWGDPPITLRCGVAAPAALKPTSQCFVIDGVGWLVTQQGKEVDPRAPIQGGLHFTTIGRSAYVDLAVPDAYQPAADALVDLAATITNHTTVVQPCR